MGCLVLLALLVLHRAKLLASNQSILALALGPAIVGNITQNAGNDMQKGMLSGCAFPLILLVSLLLLNRAGRRNN